jgi:hypothetical protein
MWLVCGSSGPPKLIPTQGWSEWTKRRLIANGTYNSDRTVNLETAERLDWAKAWRDREEQAKAAAATNAGIHARNDE